MEKLPPINEEIKLDFDEYIISITDLKGKIKYANDYFIDISLYGENELINSNHNILRHPDMPCAAFKLMWDTLKTNKKVCVLVKNLAKDGKYYWVLSEIEELKNPKTNKVEHYIAYRRAASKRMVKSIEPLYNEMKRLEKLDGGDYDNSLIYLKTFLKEKNLTYEKFIKKEMNKDMLQKIFFNAMKLSFKMVTLKKLNIF
jgi:PAS domain S-box-containing protein